MRNVIEMSLAPAHSTVEGTHRHRTRIGAVIVIDCPVSVLVRRLHSAAGERGFLLCAVADHETGDERHALRAAFIKDGESGVDADGAFELVGLLGEENKWISFTVSRSDKGRARTA